MKTVKCIKKIRNRYNQITHCVIQDLDGKTHNVEIKRLKEVMRSNQLDVVNLTLTKDGRLKDKECNTWSNKSNFTPECEERTNRLMRKAKMIGRLNSYNLSEYYEKLIYYIYTSDNDVLVYIPDDIEAIEALEYTGIFSRGYNDRLKLNIKIVGGRNLVEVKHMFEGVIANSLDIENLDTNNVKDARYMFNATDIPHMKLGNFTMPKINTTERMFTRCKTKKLDLSHFDTSNVVDMCNMFDNSRIDSINLLNFDTHNVTNMMGMFRNMKTSNLFLRSFKTLKVTSMVDMFYECKANTIDISSFNTKNVENLSHMFAYSKFSRLDLRSFRINKDANVEFMIHEFEGELIINEKDSIMRKIRDTMQNIK